MSGAEGRATGVEEIKKKKNRAWGLGGREEIKDFYVADSS